MSLRNALLYSPLLVVQPAAIAKLLRIITHINGRPMLRGSLTKSAGGVLGQSVSDCGDGLSRS
jgi:hypothetical protein